MTRTIEKQIKLPLARAVEIALKSLRARAGRSALTVVTIIMAIAFLTQVWTSRATEPQIAASQATPFANSSPHNVGTSEGGGHARTIWLVSLSLLVCLVGISNAMLMSVMERFREIGTMKCLGALNSFVLKLFFLESLFLGAVGTLLGVILGTGLTVALRCRQHGYQAWELMPWANLSVICSISMLLGLAITALAALYPAWKAARMEPVAAMRIDV